MGNEEVADPEVPGSKVKSRPVMTSGRKICLGCYCCCFCSIFIAVVVIFAVVYTAYVGTAKVEVKRCLITNLQVKSDRVVLTVTPEIYIENPNKSPLEVTITTITVDVYSLDRKAADGIGTEIFLGQGTLPSKVEVKAESNTTFTVTVDASVVVPDAVPLNARLSRDCTPRISEEKTKLGVKIKDLQATAMQVSIPVSELPTIVLEMACKSEGEYQKDDSSPLGGGKSQKDDSSSSGASQKNDLPSLGR